MGAGLLLALFAALGILGVLVFLLITAFLNPEKTQRWAEMIWAAISKVWRAANRRAVQHGVQSRLMYFAADLARETGAPSSNVKIEWADQDEKPVKFFQDDRVVIRLHSHEHQERNLMTASLLYVSHTLVRRAKRFLSKRQARSVDLFATDRLLTKTAPAAADLLHEEILGPECDSDRELAELLVEYQRIDRRANGFFPIFVRELNYLGQKVVVKPRGGELIADVKDLHGFLVRYADRVVGEEIPLSVQGRFLRCAVMIIAKTKKRELGNRAPYVRHLQELARAGHETIYLIGSAVNENQEFMVAIARDFRSETGWMEVDRRTYAVVLGYSDGTDFGSRNLLIVLRSNQSRDYIGEARKVDLPGDVPEVVATEPAA